MKMNKMEMIDKIKNGYEVTDFMIKQFKNEEDAFPWPDLEDMIAEKLEYLANDGIRIADDDKTVLGVEKELFIEYIKVTSKDILLKTN